MNALVLGQLGRAVLDGVLLTGALLALSPPEIGTSVEEAVGMLIEPVPVAVPMLSVMMSVPVVMPMLSVMASVTIVDKEVAEESWAVVGVSDVDMPMLSVVLSSMDAVVVDMASGVAVVAIESIGVVVVADMPMESV